MLKEFENITKKYDDSMFEIFKRVIDEAKTESKKNNLDSIEIFIYVSDKLRFAYAQLALAQGIISNENNYNEALNKYIISEKLLERICVYTAPIAEAARNAIKLKAEEILQSTSLDELQNEYNSLFSLLSNDSIQENPWLYEAIELTKKITL